MKKYIILLRGINVGGKNKLPMKALTTFLESLGCTNIITYIQSGNVILDSKLTPQKLKQTIESNLVKNFKLDSSLIKVLVLTPQQLSQTINNKPTGFGEEPEKYHSDVIFLIDIKVSDALLVFDPKEGIDYIWPGDGVIYSQRLSAQRTKSRLSKIMGTTPYRSMTIRNWNTTTKLASLLNSTN